MVVKKEKKLADTLGKQCATLCRNALASIDSDDLHGWTVQSAAFHLSCALATRLAVLRNGGESSKFTLEDIAFIESVGPGLMNAIEQVVDAHCKNHGVPEVYGHDPKPRYFVRIDEPN